MAGSARHVPGASVAPAGKVGGGLGGWHLHQEAPASPDIPLRPQNAVIVPQKRHVRVVAWGGWEPAGMGGGWSWGRGHPKVARICPRCHPAPRVGVSGTIHVRPPWVTPWPAAPRGDKGHLGSPICLAPSWDTSGWGKPGGKGPAWRIWGHERGRGRGSEVQPRRLSPGSRRTPMGLRGAGKQLTRRITAFHKSYFSSGLNSLPCAGGRAGPKGGHGRTPVPGTGSGRGAQHQRPRAVTPSGTRHGHAWLGSTGGLVNGG